MLTIFHLLPNINNDKQTVSAFLTGQHSKSVESRKYASSLYGSQIRTKIYITMVAVVIMQIVPETKIWQIKEDLREII